MKTSSFLLPSFLCQIGPRGRDFWFQVLFIPNRDCRPLFTLNDGPLDFRGETLKPQNGMIIFLVCVFTLLSRGETESAGMDPKKPKAYFDQFPTILPPWFIPCPRSTAAAAAARFCVLSLPFLMGGRRLSYSSDDFFRYVVIRSANLSLKCCVNLASVSRKYACSAEKICCSKFFTHFCLYRVKELIMRHCLRSRW